VPAQAENTGEGIFLGAAEDESRDDVSNLQRPALSDSRRVATSRASSVSGGAYFR
jgi:hypothetical protein